MLSILHQSNQIDFDEFFWLVEYHINIIEVRVFDNLRPV